MLRVVETKDDGLRVDGIGLLHDALLFTPRSEQPDWQDETVKRVLAILRRPEFGPPDFEQVKRTLEQGGFGLYYRTEKPK